MNAAKVLEDLKRRFPNEPEYHQAVEEDKPVSFWSLKKEDFLNLKGMVENLSKTINAF